MSLKDKIFGFFGFKKAEPVPLRELRPAEMDDIERWESDRYGVYDGGKGRLGDLGSYLDLYRTQPWVYVCARDISQAFSTVDYQITNEGKEISKDDYRYRVIRKPNPFETFSDVRKKTSVHLELTGNSFWELVRDDKENLIGIYILRPDLMRIQPHPKYKIAGYRYEIESGKEILFSPDEIIHFKYIDPKDDYWGMPPAMAAQIGITLDFFAQTWNKNFFINGAEPGGILETDYSLSPQAHERLINNWMRRHRGGKNSHIPAILEEGMKYKPIESRHDDMQFIEQRKMSKEEIFEVFDVPINWRTDLNQKKSFYFSNIIPKLRWFSESINETLLNKEGTENKDKFEITFLTRSIEAMVEDEQIKSEIAQSNTTHGIMTINEVRERYYGLPPRPWGEDWWAPVGLAPTSAGVHPTNSGNEPGRTVNDGYSAGLSDPSQVPKLGQNSRLDNIRSTHPETASPNMGKREWLYLDKIEVEEPDWNDKRSVRNWRSWTTWQKAASPDERKLVGRMRAFFDGQFGRLRDSLRTKYRVKKNEKDEIEIVKDDINIDIVLNWDDENKKLQQVYINEAERMLQKHGKLIFAQLDIDTDFDSKNERLTEWMEKYSATRVRQVNNYTKELIRASLVDSVKNGDDFETATNKLKDIFADVEGGMSDFRARRIARTELVTLSNSARLEAARQSGITKSKTWISQRLPTTRQEPDGADHLELHGITIPISENFVAKNRSGQDEMDGPGDINASPENCVNCLCLLDFSTDGSIQEENIEEKRKVQKSKEQPQRSEPVVVNLEFPKTQEPIAEQKEEKKPKIVGEKIKLVRDEQYGNILGVEKEFIYEKESENGGHDEVSGEKNSGTPSA